MQIFAIWNICMKTRVSTAGQLGPALIRLRKEKGLSQAGIGKRIGLSQERISAIERHPERVTFDAILTLMMALDADFIVESRNSLSANTKAESTATADLTVVPKDEW